MIFRFIAPLLFVTCSALVAATSPLETAVQKLVESDQAWAYTQVIRRTDQNSGDTIARFDPSKPAGSQWELVQLHGRAPSPSEAESWCKKRSQQFNETTSRLFLDLLDLPNASLVEETGSHLRFEIPLRKQVIAHVPTENFVAYADVDPESELLERLSVVLKQSIRLAGGCAEVQSAEGEVVFRRFGDEDARPDYIIAKGSGQALFKRVNRSGEILFTDQRRVKS